MKRRTKASLYFLSCVTIFGLFVLFACVNSVKKEFYFVNKDTVQKGKINDRERDPMLSDANTISKADNLLQKQSQLVEFSLNKMEGDIKKPVNNSVSEEYMYIQYEQYVTTVQTTCNSISRCGKFEAGYDVCVDTSYKPSHHCVVYSFGSRFSFGFENDVFRRFHCEIHTFDPSLPLAGHIIPNGVNFHLIGLSEMDHKNELGWKMKTLSSIREYLNHSYTQLDILKLDIEGYEWRSLPQILATVSSTDIKQLLLEVHFGRQMKSKLKNGFMASKKDYWGFINPYIQLNILKQLKLYGFYIFTFHENKITKIPIKHFNKKSVTECYSLSMKNINIS